MSLNWPKSGPASVPEYQLSGVPFVTSSCDPAGVTVATGRVPECVEPIDATAAKIRLAAAVTPYRVEFPFVTRWVQITNMGTKDLRCGFTENGVRGMGEAKQGGATGTDPNAGFLGQNYFIIPPADTSSGNDRYPQSMRLELRCTDMYFLGNAGVTDVSVVAGLTTVHRSQFPALTGSTYTQATYVDRRNADGRMVSVQTQAPLFNTGSSGLG